MQPIALGGYVHHIHGYILARALGGDAHRSGDTDHVCVCVCVLSKQALMTRSAHVVRTQTYNASGSINYIYILMCLMRTVAPESTMSSVWRTRKHTHTHKLYVCNRVCKSVSSLYVCVLRVCVCMVVALNNKTKQTAQLFVFESTIMVHACVCVCGVARMQTFRTTVRCGGQRTEKWRTRTHTV